MKGIERKDIEKFGFIWMEPTKVSYVKIIDDINRISLATSEYSNKIQITHIYWIEDKTNVKGDVLFYGIINTPDELEFILTSLGIIE